MKKYLLFFPVLTLLPTIVACQDTTHSIIAIKNIDRGLSFIELEEEQLKNLIDNKQDFVLEFYSPYCGHCEDLYEVLKQYSDETSNIIYRFDLTKLDETEFNQYQKSYPSVFKDQYVPAIRFIKGGRLTYEVDSDKFSSYRLLKNIMDKHFLSSKISISSNLESIETYYFSHTKEILYAYDLNNPHSVRIAAENIITESFANKCDVLLINKTELGNDFDNLKTAYNVNYDTFIIYKEEEKWTALSYDYSTSTFDFNDLLSIL